MRRACGRCCLPRLLLAPCLMLCWHQLPGAEALTLASRALAEGRAHDALALLSAQDERPGRARLLRAEALLALDLPEQALVALAQVDAEVWPANLRGWRYDLRARVRLALDADLPEVLADLGRALELAGEGVQGDRTLALLAECAEAAGQHDLALLAARRLWRGWHGSPWRNRGGLFLASRLLADEAAEARRILVVLRHQPGLESALRQEVEALLAAQAGHHEPAIARRQVVDARAERRHEGLQALRAGDLAGARSMLSEWYATDPVALALAAVAGLEPTAALADSPLRSEPVAALGLAWAWRQDGEVERGEALLRAVSAAAFAAEAPWPLTEAAWLRLLDHAVRTAPDSPLGRAAQQALCAVDGVAAEIGQAWLREAQASSDPAGASRAWGKAAASLPPAHPWAATAAATHARLLLAAGAPTADLARAADLCAAAAFIDDEPERLRCRWQLVLCLEALGDHAAARRNAEALVPLADRRQLAMLQRLLERLTQSPHEESSPANESP